MFILSDQDKRLGFNGLSCPAMFFFISFHIPRRSRDWHPLQAAKLSLGNVCQITSPSFVRA